MKALILCVLVLLVGVQAGTLEQLLNRQALQTLFKNNECFQGYLQVQTKQLSMEFKEMALKALISNSTIQLEELKDYAMRLGEAFEHCNMNPYLGNGTSWIKVLGEAFELGSKCLRDVGTVILLIDSIVINPKSVFEELYIGIFLVLVSYMGYMDCTAWIEFILNIIRPIETNHLLLQ